MPNPTCISCIWFQPKGPMVMGYGVGTCEHKKRPRGLVPSKYSCRDYESEETKA